MLNFRCDALKRQGQCTGEASRTDLRIVVTGETIRIRDAESFLVGRFHHRSSFVIRRANTPWCVDMDREVYSSFCAPIVPNDEMQRQLSLMKF